MIYEWSSAGIKYAGYTGKTDQDLMMIAWESPVLGIPLSPLEHWQAPTLEQYLPNGGRPKKLTDCINAGHRLINQKSADVLADIWEKHATLYPVILDDHPDENYYMVVVNTVIDCIDREKSVGSLNTFDDHGYFSNITEWVMIEEEIGGNDLFVLPDKPTAIYTTERFKQRVIDAGLTGFGFIKKMFDEEKAFIS